MGEPASVKGEPIKVGAPKVTSGGLSRTIISPQVSAETRVNAVQGQIYDSNAPEGRGISAAITALDPQRAVRPFVGIEKKGPAKGGLTISGRMDVSFTIGKDGHISEVTCDMHGLNGSPQDRRRLTDGVAGVVANLSFTPPSEGEATVEFPLIFTTR